MSRQTILKLLKKQNPKLSKSEVAYILDEFSNSIKNALKDNMDVRLKGFGAFFIKKIKAKHNARNPKSGEIIYIPEKNRVRFKASKKLKEFINK